MAFKTLTNWRNRSKRAYKKPLYIQDTFPIKNIDWSVYQRRVQVMKNGDTAAHDTAPEAVETEYMEYLDDAATSFDYDAANITDYSIWHVGGKEYSVCMQLTDTNYSVLSQEHKDRFLQKHWDFLNSLEVNATTSFTVCNRYLQDEDIEKKKIPLNNTRLDSLRLDVNNVIENKARTGSRIRKDRYVTITAEKGSFEDARLFFNNVTQSTARKLDKMGVHSEVLDDTRRFLLMKSFFQDEKAPRTYDREECLQKLDFYAAFAPNELTFKKSYFKTENQYGRVFYIHDFPAFLYDTLMIQLSDILNPMMVSFTLVPVPTVEAIKQLRNTNTGIETNIAEYTRKQNKQNNFNANIPPDLEEARNNTREMIRDINNHNQRLFFGQLTLVCLADSMKDLKQATAKLNSIVSEHGCTLTNMTNEQEPGLMTVVPFGVTPIIKPRTFITESASVLHPYNVQEIDHDGGLYYGTNPISRNMIFFDRSKFPNGNAVLLGTSGSGKSFVAKREMMQVALKYAHDHILVIDPEREYAPLVRKLGGTVINISAATRNYINPLDIPKELLRPDRLKEHDVIRNKNDFVLSLCEEVMQHTLTAMERSIIDRCVTNIYEPYVQAFMKGEDAAAIEPPTLLTFYEELQRQKEQEARQIALAVELYVKGSMDIFSHQTNVDTSNNIIAFDILELGAQLKTVAMLVVLEFIQGRVTENRFSNQSGNNPGREVIHTWLYIDECHVLLTHQQSANYLFNLWKRLRKYAGLPTAITQNVPDLLRSEQSLAIFANSDVKILCRQSETDQKLIKEYMNFTDEQMGYVNRSETGGGVLVLTNDFIPFSDTWDRNSLSYKYMSTKPGEDAIENETELLKM